MLNLKFEKLEKIGANVSFNELEKSAKFESVLKGRQGTVLVDDRTHLIPIVRTTTKYNTMAQKFSPIHYKIMEEIGLKFKNKYGDYCVFNSALIEIYDDTYCKMGFHTDQALDLDPDSYICLYSCYESNPANLRKLVIQNKETKKYMDILLENNTAIIFSTKTNSEHLHKIVLEGKLSGCRWLGITFRLSKTFVKFIDNSPFLCDRKGNIKSSLTMATDDEKKEFYHHKGKENSSIKYIYPDINYTISLSDLMQIKY